MHRINLLVSLLAALAIALVVGRSDAQTLTTLLPFDGTNGQTPLGSLTQVGSNLYGTTTAGGAYGDGTIFSVPVAGGAPTTLLSFNGANGEGPFGSLTLSADGSSLYGMTSNGGANNLGVAFSIPVAGGAPTTLATFNGANGGGPFGSLTLSGSTLYGMTLGGGVQNEGTIFSVPVAGGTPTVLASFTNGEYPEGSLTLSGSTLYGMTSGGGANGDGMVFSIPATGGAPTDLLDFNGVNGSSPLGDLTLIGSTLYGMTVAGGANGLGNIFSIPITGGTPTDLLDFNGTNGERPYGDLLHSGSTLYGTTEQGGPYDQAYGGDGTIFSIPVAGGAPTTLATFNGTDGKFPLGSLTLAGSTLYGTTGWGGLGNNADFFSGDGTVFALNLVPEPSSIVLLGLGGLTLGAIALRRRMRHHSG